MINFIFTFLLTYAAVTVAVPDHSPRSATARSFPVLDGYPLIRRGSSSSSKSSPKLSTGRNAPTKVIKPGPLGYKAHNPSKPRSNSAEQKRNEILERRKRQQYSNPSTRKTKSRSPQERSTRSNKKQSSPSSSPPRRASSLPPHTPYAKEVVGVPSSLSPLRLRPTRQREIQYRNEKRLDVVRMEHFPSEHDGKKSFRDPSQYS